MSIKFKLTLIIVAILLIDGLAMGAFIYWQNNRVITAHLNSDITNTVDQVTQLVNFYVDRAENNLTSLAIGTPAAMEIKIDWRLILSFIRPAKSATSCGFTAIMMMSNFFTSSNAADFNPLTFCRCLS